MNWQHLDLLSDEEIRQALAEIKQLGERIKRLELQRESIFAAIDEVDVLTENVNDSAKKIKQHLKEAM